MLHISHPLLPFSSVNPSLSLRVSFLQRLLRPRHPRASDSHYRGRLFLLPRWLRDPTRFASLPRHGPLRRPVIRRSTPFFPLSLQEQPLESLFPESLLEETDLYNPFDFIVFVEQNMERVTVADQMAACQGEWHAIHRLSETAGYSRPRLHHHSLRSGDQESHRLQRRGPESLLISLSIPEG